MLVAPKALRQIRGRSTILLGIACRLYVDVIDANFRQFIDKGILAESGLVAPRRLPYVRNDANASLPQRSDICVYVNSLIA